MQKDPATQNALRAIVNVVAFPKQTSRVTPNNTRPLSPVLFLPPHRSIFLQPRSSRHKLSNDSQMTAVGRLGDVGEPVTVEDRSQNTFTKMHPLRTRICRYQTSLAPTRHHYARCVELAPRQPSLQATSRRIHKPSLNGHRSSTRLPTKTNIPSRPTTILT